MGFNRILVCELFGSFRIFLVKSRPKKLLQYHVKSEVEGFESEHQPCPG